MPNGDLDLSNIDVGALLNRQRVNPRFQGAENLLQQVAQGGFTGDQFNLLVQQLQQQLGASERLGSAITRQSVAGAPRAVQQAAFASQQNRARGALQRGVTGIQSAGLQRQQQALMALLQAQLQREQISEQRRAGLLSALFGVAVPGGELLFDFLSGLGGGGTQSNATRRGGQSGLSSQVIDPGLFLQF